MSQATSASEGRAPASVKIPLRLRLKAWWNGHEIRVKEPSAAAADSPAFERGSAEADPFLRWNETHLRVAQAVWGPGMIGPTGPEEIRDLVKPLGLNPAMSLLHVGAGLGGAGRVMTESFGVWVTGIESERELVKAGMALAEAAGVAKKAPVVIFDPDSFEPKAESYDCIVSFGCLFGIQNRMRLIDVLNLALKPNGQLLITDFVLARPGLESRVLADWMASEPEETEPWSMEQYKIALEGRGLEVRIVEDRSDVFREQVVKSWADYMSAVNVDASDPDTSAALVHEVELWTSRTRALEAGDLRHCRIYARRKAGANLLADW